MARSALSIFIFKRLQLSQSLPSGHAPALYGTPLLSGDPPLRGACSCLLTFVLPSGLWPHRPGSAVALPVASAPQFRKLSLWLGPQSPSSPPAARDPQLLSVLSPQVHFPHLHLSFLPPSRASQLLLPPLQWVGFIQNVNCNSEWASFRPFTFDLCKVFDMILLETSSALASMASYPSDASLQTSAISSLLTSP